LRSTLSEPVRASPPPLLLPPPNILSRSWKEAPRGLPPVDSLLADCKSEEEDDEDEEDDEEDEEEDEEEDDSSPDGAAARRMWPRDWSLMRMVVVLVMSRSSLGPQDELLEI
jgi:hypothetical protein